MADLIEAVQAQARGFRAGVVVQAMLLGIDPGLALRITLRGRPTLAQLAQVLLQRLRYLLTGRKAEITGFTAEQVNALIVDLQALRPHLLEGGNG
jgi:hypothetical protein